MVCTTGDSCNTNTGVCGTGGWTGPKPGDPDNNVTLSANAAYGGIDVSWTYPSTNAHAVIHTLLYRGVTNDFTAAVQQRVVAGNSYRDVIPATEIKQYFYWIKMVSVNGTVGDTVGPASAIPLAAVTETLESLTGLIDEGYLAQSLKTRIDKLDILNRELGTEILDRIANNEALATALAAVQSETGEAMTYLQDEITQRTSTQEAMISSINALAVGLAGNDAALVEEKTLRVNAIEALASDVGILYTDFAENTAAIISESTARTTADESLASQLNVLAAENDTLGAALQAEANARVTANSALANQLNTAQTTLGNNLASVQTNMESKISTVDGKVISIGALYTAKVDVNGLVGGFGVYNDGKSVEAGFDVDRFWVGRTTNKVKPFIVSNGVVHIDKARIRNADIDTLKIAGNAITVPLSVKGSPGGSLGANTAPYGIMNVGGVFPDTCKVTLLGFVQASNPGNSTNVRMRLIVDNSVVAVDMSDSTDAGRVQSHTAFASATVSAGYHTFELQIGNDYGAGGPWSAINASLIVLGTAR